MNVFGLRRGDRDGAGDDRGRDRRVAVHDRALAADAALGRGGRRRHRHDRAGAGRHGGDALVHRAARADRRADDREQRHGPARLPAAARGGDRGAGLAGGARDRAGDARGDARAGAAADARPAGGSRAAALRRGGGAAGAGAGPPARRALHRAAGGAGGGVAERDVLGAVRDVLRLRALDQRSDPDALDLDLRRLRDRRGGGGRRSSR